MESPVTTKPRSNKYLTSFMLSCLDLFLMTSNYTTERSRGNTKVKCTKKEHLKKFEAFVLGEKIAQIILCDQEPVAFQVSMGGIFDYAGRPMSDVIERLNGLFDALGNRSIIPTNLRIFYDREEELFYIGKKQNKIPVGLLYTHDIDIEINHEDLQMTTIDGFFND